MKKSLLLVCIILHTVFSLCQMRKDGIYCGTTEQTVDRIDKNLKKTQEKSSNQYEQCYYFGRDGAVIVIHGGHEKIIQTYSKKYPMFKGIEATTNATLYDDHYKALGNSCQIVMDYYTTGYDVCHELQKYTWTFYSDELEHIRIHTSTNNKNIVQYSLQEKGMFKFYYLDELTQTYWERKKEEEQRLAIIKREDDARIAEQKRQEEARIIEQKRQKESEETAKRNIQIQANSDKSLWKLGNKICTEKNTGVYQATIDQWNEDKTQLKVIVIAGPSNTFEGQKAEKGSSMWVSPTGWHLCIEYEIQKSLSNDNSSATPIPSNAPSNASSCSSCGGHGRCTLCAGKGKRVCKSCSGDGKNHSWSGSSSDRCSSCKGTGSEWCYDCNGSGSCSRCRGTGK